MSDDLIRPISDLITAAREPLSEDLMRRYRDNDRIITGALDSGSAFSVAGAVDSVTSGTIFDVDPTSGSIQQDSQFNGYYLHFTSGAAFSANSRNRFKIIATSLGASSLSVTENLAVIGVVATDTYVVLGHTHDGDATTPDGAKIDLKELTNVESDFDMTQNQADALTDPDGNRPTVANKANPFATIGSPKFTTAYSETGQSQSGTRSTAGQTDFTHDLILPNAATDYLVIGTFDLEADISSSGSCFANLEINSVQFAIATISGIGNRIRGEIFAVIAQDGQEIKLSVNVTGGSVGANASGAFNVLTFQELV